MSKEDPIIGHTIKAVRFMTKQELEQEMWYGKCVVIELDNGVKLYPSRDDEGNGPGMLFGDDDCGSFRVYPHVEKVGA